MERPAPATIPDAPGSYQFFDTEGRVIYVGKARSLRSRIGSYFQNPEALALKTARMMAEADRVEWIQVANDPEAILLEYSLIKTHRPRYNVQLRDDKSYPYLALTTSDEWPRPVVVRGSRRKGTTYFGPYASAGALRETLDLLVRSIPLRTCSDAKLVRHTRMARPCLLFHIERCCGPCIAAVERGDYDEMVREMKSFLRGDTSEVLEAIEGDMNRASAAQEYERAARLRDRLDAARRAVETQQMVTTSTDDMDILGIDQDDLEASVQVFHIRRGRVIGTWGFILDKAEDLAPPALVAKALSVLYAETKNSVPREVLVPEIPEDCDSYEQWLRGERGSGVTIRIPRRGAKRALHQTVTMNAAAALIRERLRRGMDHKSRTDALEGLRHALGMTEAPLRIECYDMSHIQGTDYVGSMVVVEDALPRKRDYRHFRVRGREGNDDYAAMREVLERRLAHLVDDGDTGAGTTTSFARTPNLLLVDGGRGQLGVALSVVEKLGLGDRIFVASLAKKFEQVFVAGREEPVDIPRPSESLYLLQRVRDEAHRFAVTHHRALRAKRMVAGSLDGVPGLGPARRKRLLAELGGIRGVRSATPEMLDSLVWLPESVRAGVYERLHGTGDSLD